MSLTFKVIPISYQDATSFDDCTSDFLLEMDNWNDYNYRTLYHLHASKKLTKKKTKYLGYLHIMKISQNTDEPQLFDGLYANNKYFTHLPENFISMSFSLDLYRGVVQYLKNKDQRDAFINSLHLILDSNDEKYFKVKDDDCFNKSVLRGVNMDNYSLRKGKELLLENGTYYDLENNNIKIKFQNSNSELNLFFGKPNPEIRDNTNLPYGVIALIGNNGCGKSTFMYDFAKALYMEPHARMKFDKIKIEPQDIGITKVLFFSFSAFDNFMFPGQSLEEYKLMAEGVKNNDGRFVYCGIRNIIKELEDLEHQELEKKKLVEQKNNDENTQHEINIIENTSTEIRKINYSPIHSKTFLKNDRMKKTSLKTNDSLRKDFNNAMNVIIQDKIKTQRWNNMVKNSLTVLPSLYTELNQCALFLNEEQYNKLSTGIKFFINSMSYIFAYCEDNSLLLFDEPENYLHPPLLSFMINEIKKEVRNTHSVILISTHSPVIIQELFSKNVYIINRKGDELNFRHPEIEVYGESFGEINNIVFGLNTDISNYYQRFDELYDEWKCDEITDFDKLLNTFKINLSCEQLSTQIVSYLANKFYQKEEF